MAASAAPVTLEASRTDVPLVPASEGTTASLMARLRNLDAGRRVYLTLAQVKASADPGVTYNVYLNLPPTSRPQGVSDPHYAGTVSMFNAMGRPTDVALNITPAVSRLLARGDAPAAIQVTIVPAGAPQAAATPQIGKILLTSR
jgi:hypothetical protein